MPKKILIVDDSTMVRQMVCFTLEEAGYEAVSAEHGQDALDKLAKLGPQTVDLIVTDLNMPVMDGITFIARARALPATKCVPILMLTTESHPDMKQRGKAAGATGWIVKPFDPPKLLAVVTKVLG